jgi:hypothetical protein
MNHVIDAVHYSPAAWCRCSCGEVVSADSDDALVRAYRDHRRNAGCKDKYPSDSFRYGNGGPWTTDTVFP